MRLYKNSLVFLVTLLVLVQNEGSAIPIRNRDPKIVIVGSGVSSIAAATRLIENGFMNIDILEAENYWGGRIRTVPFATNVIDLGAQWCHGQGDNPVYQMGLPYDLFDVTYDPENYVFSRPNGDVVPVRHANVMMHILDEIIVNGNDTGLGQYDGSLGDFIIQKFYEALESPEYNGIGGIERWQVLDFYHRFYNGEMGSDSWYDLYGPGQLNYWEHDGYLNMNWKDNGYGTVYKLLTKSFPKPTAESINIEDKIKLNKTVTNIQYINNELKIKTDNGETIGADHVIVTVSLGVLKDRYRQLFTPSLPQYKVDAINGLSLGTVDKLIMEFEYPFWHPGWTGMKPVWTDEDLAEIRTSKANWLEGIISFDRVDYQPNLLIGWVYGSFARQMELISQEEVFESCLFMLRKFLPTVVVPTPVNFIRTTWYSNKNFRGSYSYHSIRTAALGTSPAKLAEPLYNQFDLPIVHFAGEATSDHYWSTAHGAIETGWREADRIMKYYRK